MNVIKIKEIKEIISEVKYYIEPSVSDCYNSIEEHAEMLVKE
jgi:hypothetical protein